MRDFYNLVATYTHLGALVTRSFSVVASSEQEAFDQGVIRMLNDEYRPKQFRLAVSIHGMGLFYQTVRTEDYVLTLGGDK